MAKIVLLSCTKSKLDHKAPAQELYSASPMFKKTLEYGKSLNPDKMFILSAKHHLVPLNKELDPYDKTLKEMPKDEKEKWGEETVKQMKSHGLNLEKDKFIFLTGSEYLKPFKEYIPEKNMEKPMEGRRLGERLKWLNSQISKLNEIFKRVKNLINECLLK
jgi:basic membrane lipoprotein Med (substrate-binding protein (PBP1-ABC) superfamily)